MRGRAGPVHQQRLGRAADAGAAQLGVQHDRARHGEVGVAVDIDVAVAFEVPDHRHARFLLHPRHQALAAARHDHVDVVRHAREHVADRGAIGGRHQLDAGVRQARRAQARSTRQAWMARLERWLSEPPRRITALPDFRHSAPASAVTLGRLS